MITLQYKSVPQFVIRRNAWLYPSRHCSMSPGVGSRDSNHESHWPLRSNEQQSRRLRPWHQYCAARPRHLHQHVWDWTSRRRGTCEGHARNAFQVISSPPAASVFSFLIDWTYPLVLRVSGQCQGRLASPDSEGFGSTLILLVLERDSTSLRASASHATGTTYFAVRPTPTPEHFIPLMGAKTLNHGRRGTGRRCRRLLKINIRLEASLVCLQELILFAAWRESVHANVLADIPIL